MLEGSHLFFILLAVLFFVYLIRKKSKITLLNYLIFGALTGLTVSVKATGAIVFFPVPVSFIADYKYSISRTVLDIGKSIILKGVFVVVGFLLVFATIWQIHFSLGKIVLNDKYYKASENYKEIMKNAETDDPKNFFHNA